MHQPVRIHDSDGNPITSSNPLEVDVKTLAAPTSLPLPTGAATSAKQDTLKTAIDAITSKLSSDPATQTTLAAILAAMAATPDTSAGDIADIRAKIDTMQADIALMKASESSIDGKLSGTGALKDNGPAWTVTRTYTTSADMTTAAAISPAGSEGMKLVADDILISAAVAMEFSIQQETEATVFASVFIPANGTVQITMRDGLKTATAVRKFFGKASVDGNVRITCCTHEEA